MARKKGILRRLFGLNRADSYAEDENRTGDIAKTKNESEKATLQDAVKFVTELQSYYYNDICKMQTDIIIKPFTDGEKALIKRKIVQEERTLLRIDEILKSVRQNERDYQSIWNKSIYSFYDEIEKAKLISVQEKVFELLTRLYTINTKSELKSIILNRIKKYKADWGIVGQIQIPENFELILLGVNKGTVKYQFRKFFKSVNLTDDNTYFALNVEQLDRIMALKFEIEKPFPTDEVWVYVSNVTKLQLNLMRRTCIIGNTWEKKSENGLEFDVVKLADLELYIKGILQIVFTKNEYAVISIIIPTRDVISEVEPIEKKGDRIKIQKKIRFYLKERSEVFRDNLLTAKISRREITERLRFISYLKFKKTNF